MFVAALLLFAPPAAAQDAASPIVSVGTVEPRGFGYFVGDLLRREVVVVVAEPYELEPATLPAPGRLTYWLDLKSVAVSESEPAGRRRYRLTLVYQTFYVPLSPTTRSLPPLTLRFTNGDRTVAAEVPPFDFVMAPLREVQPERPEEGPVGYLRPDAVPQGVSTRDSRIGFGAGLIAVLIALALLAYHEAWWPFRRRQERPFTRAARALRRLVRVPDDDAYRKGLLDLHRAFDAAAGQRLLAEDVPLFLSAHGEYQPLTAEIDRFFSSSRRTFFANDMAGAAKAMPLPAVAALGSQLGAAERSAP
jgi:mxaA protein